MVLAFVIPLGLLVKQLVAERALADAERQAMMVAAVLTVSNDPTTVERALATADHSAAGKVAVHNLASPVGLRRATSEEVALASRQHAPSTVPVPGGLSYLEAFDIDDGRVVVVEVFVSNEELGHGVHQAWSTLGLVALGLVLASVVVCDRLAAKVVGSARQLAAAATSLGEGDLEARVVPSGTRELADVGFAFNAMADRVSGLLANERELIADLSHRLRTPLTALRLDAETLDEERSGERIRDAIASLETEVDQLIRVARKQRTQ